MLKKVLSLILTATFILSGLTGCTVTINGDDTVETIERGESATVKNNKIELGGTTLDFGDNNAAGSEKLTELLPTEEQKPLGMVTGMYEMSFDKASTEPVTVSLPSNDLKTEDDEVLMIMVGVDFYYDDGSVITNYSYVPAEVKDGCLTALLSLMTTVSFTRKARTLLILRQEATDRMTV